MGLRITQNSIYNQTQRALSRSYESGLKVREQISTEMWQHLNRLYLKLAPLNLVSIWNDSPAHLFRETVEALNMLEGVTYSTMRHGEGWHFIQLGRYIERAQLICRLLEPHFGGGVRKVPGLSAPNPAPQPNYFDWIVLLKSCAAYGPWTQRSLFHW